MRSLPIHHCTLCVHYQYIIAHYAFTTNTSLHTMRSLPIHHCTLCVHYQYIIAHYAFTTNTSLHTIRSLSAHYPHTITHYTQTIRTSYTHYAPTSCDMLSSWPWLPVSCTATCCSSRWAVDSAELSPAGDWISSRRLTREAWRGEESGSGQRDEGEEREGGERRVRVRV